MQCTQITVPSIFIKLFRKPPRLTEKLRGMYEIDPVPSQAPCYEDVCSSGDAGAQILHESKALRSGRGPTEQKALWVL
jgi:hypothetical protein